MKQRYTLFLVLAFLSAIPLSAQIINYMDTPTQCYYISTQEMTLLGSDGGSPARNIYRDPDNNINGNFPIRVIWDAGDNRWEIQSDLGGTPLDYENLDYSNTFASYPNPPAVGTGTWVKHDAICGALTFNGTGTQTSLPVTLLSQTATVEAQDVTLSWKTGTEINTSHFVIERKEGNTFKQIGDVKAVGNTILVQSYQFVLEDQPYGNNVYRITSKDLNGVSESFAPLTVMIELADRFALSEVYPNPFNPSTNFTLAVANDQAVKIEVYDLTGKVVANVFDGQLQAQQTHTFTFKADELPSGRYFLKVQGADFVTSKMLILAK